MVTIEQEKCTGCKVCVMVCPHSVLAMNDRKAFVHDRERCVECGACELNCEYEAVTVTKGTGCLWVVINQDILKRKDKGCGCG